MTSMDDVVWIVENFNMRALEDGPDRICNGNLGLEYGLVPSKRLWAIIHGRLYGLIQKTWLYESHGLMSLV